MSAALHSEGGGGGKRVKEVKNETENERASI